MPDASWDLFFSYRRHDLDRARPLLGALAAVGVRVWRDESDIPEQASITARIRDGIANSKGFLAFYSRTYPESSACQQEITTAWLAAQEMDENAGSRIWVVNPDDSFDHVPQSLKDHRIPCVTENGRQFVTVAEHIRDRLSTLNATLLGIGMRELPAYYGMSPIQATRFVGRSTEMWNLHAKLTANRISIITGVYGQASAQVRGIGGNGKSLLAREYCIRFGQAYPGGVFWLNAYGYDEGNGSVDFDQRYAFHQDQIQEFAAQYGLSTEGLKHADIDAALWQAIKTRGKRILWVVDDLPSGLPAGELERIWNARWAGASVLITTRSKEYDALGAALDLGVLSCDEAFYLLCAHRQPTPGAEQAAARRIVELLGFHPLAVEVAGSYLAEGVEGFDAYVEALENPNEDAVEFGSLLKQSLPTGHERSISATLLKSIRKLDVEGLDFLLLSSVLALAPIPVSLLTGVFELLYGRGKTYSLKAVNQAGILSLCEHSRLEFCTFWNR
jgi:hypothetical protein